MSTIRTDKAGRARALAQSSHVRTNSWSLSRSIVANDAGAKPLKRRLEVRIVDVQSRIYSWRTFVYQISEYIINKNKI